MDQEWAEGRDGRTPVYTERLWPPWWAWLIGPTTLIVLALAFGSAYGAFLGWLIWITGTILLTALLVVTSPVLRVDECVVRAGAARLPRRYAGDPVVLDRDQTDHERRFGDARTYVVVRGWVTSRSILIPVTDHDDPHPRWLVSSRQPDAFAAAIRERQEPGRPTGDGAPGDDAPG